MDISHSLPIWTGLWNKSKRRSIVMLSSRPVKKLIIFVHGFNGSPYSTWDNFAGYIPVTSEFAGHDIIFYNYDSKGVQAINSGITLCDYIQDIVSNSNPFQSAFKNSDYTRPENFIYEEVVLVAHSLGSIVCRYALVHSDSDTSYTWSGNAKMILFAPAHMGAIALKPLMDLFFPWPFSTLGGLLRYRITTVDDVDLSSATCCIPPLLKKSEEFDLAGKIHLVIAKRVVWAEKERVVKNGQFHKDPASKLMYNHSHTDICNPHYSFKDPLQLVAEFL